MIDTLAALVTGAIIGGLAVALPDIVTELRQALCARRAERSVVRSAEHLLRSHG
jgi:hypothetical protein